MNTYDEYCGLGAKNGPEGLSFVAKFHKDKKLVEIDRGHGSLEQLRTAYSFRNLTVEQMEALTLGLQIFEYLRAPTGEVPNRVDLEKLPNCTMNYKLD